MGRTRRPAEEPIARLARRAAFREAAISPLFDRNRKAGAEVHATPLHAGKPRGEDGSQFGFAVDAHVALGAVPHLHPNAMR